MSSRINLQWRYIPDFSTYCGIVQISRQSWTAGSHLMFPNHVRQCLIILFLRRIKCQHTWVLGYKSLLHSVSEYCTVSVQYWNNNTIKAQELFVGKLCLGLQLSNWTTISPKSLLLTARFPVNRTLQNF